MANEENQVIVKAKELGEALSYSQKKKDPIEFLSLLLECNSIIERITNIDYGTTCSESQGGCC